MNDEQESRHPATATGFAGRRKTRAEERIERLDTSPAALAGQIAELREQLGASQQEAADNKAGWTRTAADFQNYRRRTEQERLDSLGLANESLLRKVLVVADDFDRAMSQMPPDLERLGWIEGVWAIDRKLRALLDSEGLTPIEADGQPFDPHQHEAVAQEETSAVADGTVVAELQRGYRLRDRVLRPAMVVVARNAETPRDGNADATQDEMTNETGREAAGGKD
ncbi:MAG: nucleotide exchange factor GrpE [Chloroflexota bacterium]|nr:nucleotide exchange factor GrpE [Chloroflexota bacterium]